METKDRDTLAQLVQGLVRDLATIVQQEMRLARAEISEKAGGMVRPVGLIAAGGALAYAGFLVILAAVVILLHALLPWWAATVLVGLVVVGAGYLLVQTGLQQIRQQDMMPRQAIASLRSIRRT
jgi:hypothetical protein